MSSLVSSAIDISFALIMIAILLGFVRLMLGPSLADRVVALDMMTVSIVAFCALFAIRTDDPVFLDIALVLALIGFLATVALARFAERRQNTLDRQAALEDDEKAAPGAPEKDGAQ